MDLIEKIMISSQQQFKFSLKMKSLFVLSQEQKELLSSYMKSDDADTGKVEEILKKSKIFELKMLKKMIEKNPELFAEVKDLVQKHFAEYKKLISANNDQSIKQLDVSFTDNDSLVAKAKKIQTKLEISDDGWPGRGSQSALDGMA